MSGSVMRAKVVVTKVEQHNECRQITCRAVCKEDGPYPKGGKDENNTFALFTPSLDLSMWINNSEIGEIKEGQKFYLDFTEAER